ncbi:probable phenylalanine--tRNA ligase, mitochondrial isoform X2 [Neodiprion fabricii]|uniref:probable phenylalanine--tRNA ligase, mitochondrial isoform X2 n=1 Tax=Neodiprion fabricii TaxID=2872261 RepID=UPI001ED938FA|nr:probable phenylalanine--tRNA ligase, mitochondrial isoform X2 [Neodiprion fabricii]
MISHTQLLRYSMLKTIRHACVWISPARKYSLASKLVKKGKKLELLDQKYPIDEWTNVTKRISQYPGKNLHLKPDHPLSLIRQRIADYFYKAYPNKVGNPLFSVHDNLRPIVTVEQNFDSLLVPKDHPSRSKTDCYYVNSETLLRAHTTAHQAELILMGLNNFLIIGDVYRRDDINSTHYPVFHQVDGVRLRTQDEIFQNVEDSKNLRIFEHRESDSPDKQGCHTLEATKIMEHELKTVLVGLVKSFFGQDVEYRWVDEYFPFTHPSWELEILKHDEWLEVLGCGIVRQEILQKSGAADRIGWAFGAGLERLAMLFYSIPDIRLFWSEDPGFLNQFKVEDYHSRIVYKRVSIYPPSSNDISFWLPNETEFTPNDFFEIVRDIGGDIIEQVALIDDFVHPKNNRRSHCYKITYRHMERTLTKFEVNTIHRKIGRAVQDKFNVEIR